MDVLKFHRPLPSKSLPVPNISTFQAIDPPRKSNALFPLAQVDANLHDIVRDNVGAADRRVHFDSGGRYRDQLIQYEQYEKKETIPMGPLPKQGLDDAHA